MHLLGADLPVEGGAPGEFAWYDLNAQSLLDTPIDDCPEARFQSTVHPLVVAVGNTCRHEWFPEHCIHMDRILVSPEFLWTTPLMFCPFSNDSAGLSGSSVTLGGVVHNLINASGPYQTMQNGIYHGQLCRMDDL